MLILFGLLLLLKFGCESSLFEFFLTSLFHNFTVDRADCSFYILHILDLMIKRWLLIVHAIDYFVWLCGENFNLLVVVYPVVFNTIFGHLIQNLIQTVVQLILFLLENLLDFFWRIEGGLPLLYGNLLWIKFIVSAFVGLLFCIEGL